MSQRDLEEEWELALSERSKVEVLFLLPSIMYPELTSDITESRVGSPLELLYMKYPYWVLHFASSRVNYRTRDASSLLAMCS